VCTVRVILRQLLALPCKLLSRPSTADIVKYTLHIRRVMSEEEGDVPVTWSDFEKLISAISAIEGKVLNLKRELAKEREAANECLAKCMKLDKAPTFKRRLTTSSIASTRQWRIKSRRSKHQSTQRWEGEVSPYRRWEAHSREVEAE